MLECLIAWVIWLRQPLRQSSNQTIKQSSSYHRITINDRLGLINWAENTLRHLRRASGLAVVENFSGATQAEDRVAGRHPRDVQHSSRTSHKSLTIRFLYARYSFVLPYIRKRKGRTSEERRDNRQSYTCLALVLKTQNSGHKAAFLLKFVKLKIPKLKV